MSLGAKAREQRRGVGPSKSVRLQPSCFSRAASWCPLSVISDIEIMGQGCPLCP